VDALISRFLPNLVPGFRALFNPWIWVLMITLVLVGFFAGLKIEGWRWDASLAVSSRAQANGLSKFITQQRGRNAALSGQLAAERAARASDQRSFEERLRNEKSLVSCPQPGDGAAHLSSAGVVLWNDALAIGLPATAGAGGSDGTAGAAGPVAVDDALRNLAANSAICNGLRSQLLGWQRWARENGLTP